MTLEQAREILKFYGLIRFDMVDNNKEYWDILPNEPDDFICLENIAGDWYYFRTSEDFEDAANYPLESASVEQFTRHLEEFIDAVRAYKGNT